MWAQNLWQAFSAWQRNQAARQQLALLARRPNAHLLSDVGLAVEDIHLWDDGFRLLAWEEEEQGFYVRTETQPAQALRHSFTVIEGGKPMAEPEILSRAS